MAKKHICILQTGGTIAMTKSACGKTTTLNMEDLLSQVPGLKDTASFDYVMPLGKLLDSCDVKSWHWQQIARCLIDLADSFDGFIVTHGTDTLSFTASALSFLLQGFSKPVVITGSQRLFHDLHSDAPKNLRDAAQIAASGKAGVNVVFAGKVIRGVRTHKAHSQALGAFVSINENPIAVDDWF